MIKLKETLNKEQYLKYKDKKVLLKNKVVVIKIYEAEAKRYGTWATGFKFTNTTYGMLIWEKKTFPFKKWSLDNGKTWHSDFREAKKSKNKIIMSKSTHKEWAYDSIQKINREYNNSLGIQ